MTKEYELYLFLFQVSLQPLPNPVFSIIESTASGQLYIPFQYIISVKQVGTAALHMQMNAKAQV